MVPWSSEVAAGTGRNPRCSTPAGRSRQTIYRDGGLAGANYPAYPAADRSLPAGGRAGKQALTRTSTELYAGVLLWPGGDAA